MTLTWSRHQYVEYVFDQTVETWLRLHKHAFLHFGGLPRRIVLDNVKTAIIKACFEDPVVQSSCRELVEDCGFLIAPCRPETPVRRNEGWLYQCRNASVPHESLNPSAVNAA